MESVVELNKAGKLSERDRFGALGAMKPPRECDPSEPVARMGMYVNPSAGAKRENYAKIYDPQTEHARQLSHGLITHSSGSAGEQVNPKLKTRMESRNASLAERDYLSTKRTPLGGAPPADIPRDIDVNRHTFGIKSLKGEGAAELISPPKMWAQVKDEANEGQDLYIKSHQAWEPGAQLSRNYEHPSFQPKEQMIHGVPTPHDDRGTQVLPSLDWHYIKQTRDGSHVAGSRQDDWEEKNVAQVGKQLDPNRETRAHLPSDHTFGIKYNTEPIGAGDLLHQRVPEKWLKGRERQRGLLAYIRAQLKKINYFQFDDMTAAFKHYDHDGRGFVTLEDLKRVVIDQFQLPVDEKTLVLLIDYCDNARDGSINYNEFSNFLNWQVAPPAGIGQANELDADCAERLQKQIDEVRCRHTTTNSAYGALPPRILDNIRPGGLPSVRYDKALPKTKGFSDRTNYGDDTPVKSLVNPSIFTQFGVDQTEMLRPRPSAEIFDLLAKSGLQIHYDNFMEVFNEAKARHPRGDVSVDSFRQVLDEVEHQRMLQGWSEFSVSSSPAAQMTANEVRTHGVPLAKEHPVASSPKAVLAE